MKNALATTKHFQISKILGDRLKYLAPGDSLPTVAELMQEFNASQATITQALDRLRRQGLVERPVGRKRLVVASAAERSVCRVAFIRPSWPSPDFDHLVYAVQEVAIQRHWGIDIYCYSSIDSLNLNRAMDVNDAAIFVGGSQEVPAHLKKAFQSSEKPIVILRERTTLPQLSSVSLDDYAVGKLATDHLLQLGHRRIVALMSEPASRHSSRRLSGWKDRMEKSGLANFSSLVADCSVPPGTNSTIGAYERFSAWLAAADRPKFSAIFCLDWTGALAAARSLREAGLSIPKDVSLITYSGEEKWMAFFNPPITTVEINVAEFANKSIAQIERALSGTSKKQHTAEVLKPFLMVRDSVRAYKPGQEKF